MAKQPHAIQGTCDDTSAGPHEDPLTASSGRPSERGSRDEALGSDQPQSRHILFGTSGVLSSGAHTCHGSPHKFTPSATRKSSCHHMEAAFPRYCAPQKDQWVTRKVSGGCSATKGTDPETELSGTTVSHHAHLRSASVVVDAGSRTEWEPPALCAALSDSVRPAQAPPRWLPAFLMTRRRVCVATDYVWLRSPAKVQKFARDAEIRRSSAKPRKR